LTVGLPDVLTGVMALVALLPPAASLDLMLSRGHLDLIIGAGLLMAAPVVCLSLAAKLVFLRKTILPRTLLFSGGRRWDLH
jgi:uncharacterized membrane protein